MGNMLRHLGYNTSFERAQYVVQQVDVDASGTVEFKEFLKAMRHFREVETEVMRRYFVRFTGGEEGGRLPLRDLARVLLDFGYAPNARTLNLAVLGPGHEGNAELDMDGSLLFDDFLSVVQRVRMAEVEKHRERAGFSEDEVAQFREEFASLDRDRSGKLSMQELNVMLVNLEAAPRSTADQKRLEWRIGEVSEGRWELSFTEFLRLLRSFTDDVEYAKVQKERQMAKRCGTSHEEVAQFREIFAEYDQGDQGALTLGEVRKVLRTLHVRLDHEQQERLRVYFTQADEDASGSLDFAEFLLIMKILTEADFAGINEASKEVMTAASRARLQATRGVEAVLMRGRQC